ncbi:pre-mRNA-processing protein 40A-like isoform X1 [Thraustotheca clavata]|uniref:Pre-mRNA-processing protein 40A-like isoform X1 n=1 Tax=Thraustotheca clavata TaxID=74557 RepID=A0A1W0A5P7_9STRA|nr:pre-mRNA-processing protein 40A-like isoform X1 [Thraustotheca clavata]
MAHEGYVSPLEMKTRTHEQECPWTEYMDDATGKPYYYNSETKACVWDEPPEFCEFKARKNEEIKHEQVKQQETTQENKQESNELMEVEMETTPLNDTKTDDDEEEDISKYATMSKPDRIAAFKNLLKSIPEITPKMKWNEAVRLIEDEPAFYALATIGEKKQAYAEYLPQLAKEIEINRRKKQKLARENFVKLLASCTKITVSTRWHEAIQPEFGLVNDERFKALEDQDEKRDLFASFIDDLVRTEREFARKKRDQHRQTILDYYALPELGITLETRWTTLREVVFGNEKIMALGVPKRDLEDFFFEYLDKLKKQAQEAQRLARIKAREAEDALAATFKTFLQGEIDANRLTPDMRWRDCIDTFESNAAFVQLRNSNTVLARDVFEEVMDRWYTQLRDEKHWLLSLIEKNGFIMKHTTTMPDFLEQLRHTVESLIADDTKSSKKSEFYAGLRSVETVPPSVRTWFEQNHRNEVERIERIEAARKKKLEAFHDMLTEYYYRSDHLDVTWETARRDIERRSSYRAMESESVAKEAFHAYMDKLKEKMNQVLKTRKPDDERKSRSRKRSAGSSSDSESSRSPSSSRKHKKKHKKKKSSKKHKKRSRSRSSQS